MLATSLIFAISVPLGMSSQSLADVCNPEPSSPLAQKGFFESALGSAVGKKTDVPDPLDGPAKVQAQALVQVILSALDPKDASSRLQKIKNLKSTFATELKDCQNAFFESSRLSACRKIYDQLTAIAYKDYFIQEHGFDIDEARFDWSRRMYSAQNSTNQKKYQALLQAVDSVVLRTPTAIESHQIFDALEKEPDLNVYEPDFAIISIKIKELEIFYQSLEIQFKTALTSATAKLSGPLSKI